MNIVFTIVMSGVFVYVISQLVQKTILEPFLEFRSDDKFCLQ